MRLGRWGGLALAAGLINFSAAYAATITLTLSGTITDATHATPCAGAVVMVDSSSNTFVTLSNGYFLLYNLTINSTPGQYHSFTITKSGYAPYREERPDYIPAGGTVTHNAGIYVGALVTGTVTAALGGAPVAGVTITANNEGNTTWQQVVTLSNGTYALQAPPGVNYLRADAVGYAASLYSDLTCSDQGTNVQNFLLYRGGWISGSVTLGGAAAAYVTVTASVSGSTEDRPKSTTITTADGSYLLSQVYPIASDITVTAPWGYANGYRSNVPVSDGTTTSAINFALGTGGGIQGVVQDYLGNPVNSAQVTVFPNSGNTALQQSSQTNTAGAYAFVGVPVGVYSVTIKPQSGANLETLEIGGVKVTAGAMRTRNATLQLGGKVTGTLQDQNGQPVAGAQVVLSLDAQYPFNWLQQTISDVTGAYTLDGLTPLAAYSLEVRPGASSPLVSSAVKRSLKVSQNDTIEQDFTLGQGGGRQGTVQDIRGLPVSGAMNVILNANFAIGNNSADQNYSMLNIPKGNYIFAVLATSGNYQPYMGYFQVIPMVVENYPITLADGGYLIGTVVEADSNTTPVINAAVKVKERFSLLASIPQVEKVAYTDSNGNYFLQGLTPGTYDVEVMPETADDGGYAGQQARNISLRASSEPVQNFSLVNGGSKVYGSLQDSFGNRVAQAIVYFWSATSPTQRGSAVTDQNGNYSLMLLPGKYAAQAYYSSMLGTNLAMEPMNNINVPAPPTARDVELTLATGGSVTGTVQDQLGKRIPLALVSLVAQQDSTYDPLPARLALTNNLGNYEVDGLHTGVFQYLVQAQGYQTLSGSVTVSLGEITGGLRMVLVAQTSLAGTVKDSGGHPLAQAVVEALDASGNLVLQTATNTNGQFILQPLSGGTFQVKATALGMKSQTQTNHVLGDRADFVLEPLIGTGEVISYPNPCRGDHLTFLYWLEQDATVLIRVYNQAGELVWDSEAQDQGQQYNKRIWEVGGVAPGVYLFKTTARDAQNNRVEFPVGKLTVIKK